MSHDHVHPHQPRQHDGQSHPHPHGGAVVDRRAALRSGAVGIGALLLAACGSNTSDSTGADSGSDASSPPAEATATGDVTKASPDSLPGAASVDVLAGFDAFADTVTAFTSGEDGRFRLAVPAGLYALKAASSGYGVGFVEEDFELFG